MEVRYQLRHSPAALRLPGQLGNLSQPRSADAKSGRPCRSSSRRVGPTPVVGRQPQPRAGRARRATAQPQLSTPRSVGACCVRPAEQRRRSADLEAGAVGDHDAGLPRRPATSRHSRSAGHHPGRDVGGRSRRPGTRCIRVAARPRRRTPRGRRSRELARMVMPCRAPTSNSRSRSSTLAASPVARSTYAQVCRARARSEVHSAAGAQRGEGRRDGGGLRVADLVELDVGVALGPAGVVPGGPAVPEQDQPARLASVTGRGRR